VERILNEPSVRKWDERIEINDIDQCAGLGPTIQQVFLAYARRRGKEV
jgi:hypothetical protein